MRNASRALLWLTLCLVLSAGPAALAQKAVVSSAEGTVVVDGGFVRIESPEGVAKVSGDWRGVTSVKVADTDAVLVELGAVRDGDVIRLNLAGDVLFGFGSAALDAAAEAVLTKVAQVIRERALGRVLVVGHTDAIGDAATNQRLSEARAVSVIRWLNARAGIPTAILEARGMGEERPVASNTTADGRDNPAGRARNRRVELYLGATEHADVRAAAGLVTVQTDSGEVRIGEGAVDVGDVAHIEAGSVTVGGLRVSSTGVVQSGGGTRVAGSGDSITCSAGRICEADCPDGDCRLSCSAGATCTFGCSGGDCDMLCAAGATCSFTCSGGDCHFTRALGSSCSTSCTGGGCTGG